MQAKRSVLAMQKAEGLKAEGIGGNPPDNEDAPLVPAHCVMFVVTPPPTPAAAHHHRICMDVLKNGVSGTNQQGSAAAAYLSAPPEGGMAKSHTMRPSGVRAFIPSFMLCRNGHHYILSFLRHDAMSIIWAPAVVTSR